MSEVRADVEAERAMLGMLLAGSDPAEASKVVKAADFWQPRHEHIWRAMTRVREAGNPINNSTVRVALDQAELSVDPTYLLDLYANAPLAGDPAWYAQRIAGEARFRALDAAAATIKQASQNRALDIDAACDVARRAVDEATAREQRAKHARVADVLPQVLDIAEGGATPALSTPWPDLDRMITGLSPGRLVIVGARPGVGKSVMGTNLALHFAREHQHAVLIVSMEMERLEVGQRLVSSLARVNLTNLSAGNLAERQWEDIRQHYNTLESLPITIDDTSHQTVTSIRDTARDIARERDDLALIVVDYLQLMSSVAASGRASRTEVVGEVSRGLKVLARETGACVVAMAQVNREAVRSTDGRPKMSDLRESGSIEADADQVILLHRPDETLPDVEVIVDKNRWGPKGVCKLQMFGHYASLRSASWSPSMGVTG